MAIQHNTSRVPYALRIRAWQAAVEQDAMTADRVDDAGPRPSGQHDATQEGSSG